MSIDGSQSMVSGQGKCFAFIDADNAHLGFQASLSRRKIKGDDLKAFSFENLLRAIPAQRRYLFGAAPSGSQPHDWLVRLRSESSFIYRQGRLVQKAGSPPKQEGVDVMLAVEALRCANSRIMESCVIVSDDGDLIPLVRALVDCGIHTSVYGFNDPLLSDVAAELQDSCDQYVHIGSRILGGIMSYEFRMNFSSNTNKEMFAAFGKVETRSVGGRMFSFSQASTGLVYISDTSFDDMNEFSNARCCCYPNIEAAMLRHKIMGDFFQ